mmetsp:Transcript_37202/g.68911  ORF Transcript_37202/g.68911 Transcript_37202/m.68911 type:complete len:558 (-) Transcript_37202:59-1732(-)
MRLRPNARQTMPKGDETSSLFQDEEPTMPIRRRPVPRTQMGDPPPKKVDQKRRPVVEWTKAIMICFGLISVFLTFTWFRRSRHLQRKSANFDKLDKCDLRTYPLWQIGKLEELNLSGCGHINLHDDSELWSRFKSLKKLDLNNNNLTDLPGEMGVLTSLEILFLSENKFEGIPKVIGELKNLRILSLKGNLLPELDSTHLPAPSLVWLIVTNNLIGKVHSNIGELKLLRKLMLSHNQIESVPGELGECTGLELLRLANNKISSMPLEVLTLPKLAWISLSGNPMSNPPKNIEKVIKQSEIKMQSKILGRGASGTVYQGTYNGKDVAVKIFKEQAKGSDGNAADEAAINGLVDHPLAMSAIGVIPLDGDDTQYKGMVMDLIRGTYPLGKVPSFDTVTRDEAPAPHSENLSKEQVLSTVWNIASALDYIHSSIGVSHSDVYLHNILRDGKFVARLSDWGASFVYDRENAESAAIFERIEVLAFGRLIQDLFDWHLNIAVPDFTESASYFGKIHRGRVDEGPFQELIASILQPDQSRRPSFQNVKEKLESIDEFKGFLKQ